jgi:hypothetical protein
MNSRGFLKLRMVGCLVGAVLFPSAALHFFHLQPQHTFTALTADMLIAMFGFGFIVQFVYLSRQL